MAKEHMDFGCEDHEDMVPHVKHMDARLMHEDKLEEHERGAAHPAHHTKGKMPSQLNPDHGPHHMHHPEHHGKAHEHVHHREHHSHK